jgi:dipeptidyl aminopeptidase/acylaminoacyl peptidase
MIFFISFTDSSIETDSIKASTMTPSPALLALDRLRFVSNLTFTHRGDAVVATVRNATSDAGKPNPSRIWRFDGDGSKLLTDGPNGDDLARPSPCDDRIAFVSDRACRGKNALFLLGASGDLQAIGDVPGTIEDLRWSPDATFIVVLAADRGLSGGATHSATRIWWGNPEEPELASCGTARRRLFRIFLDSGKTEEVGPRAHSVWEFDLVPGGAVAVASWDASERGWHHAQLIRIDFDERLVTVLHSTAWQLQGLAVDPSGSKVAFLEGWSSDRGLVAGVMSILDLDTNSVSVLARDQQSNVTFLRWRDTTSLWFAGWERLGTIYGVIRTDGAIESQRHEDACLSENGFLAQIAISANGKKIAAVRESIGAPQEVVWKHLPDEEWTKISTLNEEVASAFANYPEMRHIEWRGTDGLALEAFIVLPRNGGDKPPAMIVDIHGGPCYAAKHSFNPNGALAYAAAGFAVFTPNYRGNVGWGEAFTQMNLGDPAGGEFNDILAGIDRCIALGLADPERLGVTGSSYGGYLTNWAVVSTNRFKAAVPVSSFSNHQSSHYCCEHDFHAFIAGGPLTVESNLRVAIDRSPLLQMTHPTTPTLLIHGSDDRCTPVSEAQQFYAALRERGVTAELVIYPREGHGGFRERAHRLDGWQRRISWFERYLNQKEDAA